MYQVPLSTPQRVGVVIYGLLVGVGTAAIVSAASFLVGLAFTLAGIRGWIHLGEYQPWLPLIGIEYGFLLGLIPGAIVCWKTWRSRLGGRRPTK
jgi:Flp pilus assembly pilin Flp